MDKDGVIQGSITDLDVDDNEIRPEMIVSLPHITNYTVYGTECWP